MTVKVLGRRLPATITYGIAMTAALILLTVAVTGAILQTNRSLALNEEVRAAADARGHLRLLMRGLQDADAADVERFYRLLEDHVIPLYYHRNDAGVPIGWVDKMRHALRLAGSRFSARRMVQNYVQAYYAPAIRGETAGDDPPTG